MNYTKISSGLSFLLRHSREPMYIDPDGGWADVDTILSTLSEKYGVVDRAVLDEIVETDEKGRYSYDTAGQRIRANQGHSIPGVIVEMEQPDPPEFLYHGTACRFIGDIMKDGLMPMTRQFVHISSDFETAVKVGGRHGAPVVLRIRARVFVDDGHKLYRSVNGVWQAEAVPPQYFEIISENE